MRTAKTSILILAVALAASMVAWADTADPATADAKPMVNVQLANTSVVDGIRALFQNTRFNYTIQPGVKGRIVEMTLKGITFDQALKAFTDAADLTYTIDEDGTYIVGPAKPTRAATTVARTSQPATNADQGTAAQAQPDQAAGQQQQAPSTPPGMIGPGLYQAAPGVNFSISQNAPVFYGPGGIPMIDNNYYNPYYNPIPYYNAGNINGGNYGNGGFGGFGWGGAYTIGAVPYVLGNTIGYPPPSGWVSPEMERLWRAQYAFQLRPYFTIPY